MSCHRVPSLLLLGLLVALPTLPRAAAEEEPRNFAQALLDQVQLGDAVVTDQLTLWPLVVPEAQEPLPVTPLGLSEVEFGEADGEGGRYDLLAGNPGKQPVLVMGGTVLVGGKRDRMVRHSALVRAEGDLLLETLPAASTSDIRKDPDPFEVAEALAPSYLRREALRGASSTMVTTFVSRWLEFREDGDERKSLVAIAESPKLKTFCLPCHQSMASLPQPKESGARVVGAIGAVHGRIQGVALFGDNRLLRDAFEMFMKGATYPAAALQIRAEKVGVSIPGHGGDTEASTEVLTKEAQDLLDRIKQAKFTEAKLQEGAAGEVLDFRTSNGTRGRAVGIDGRLVYLEAYPHDPFAYALYGSTIDVPEEGIDSDDGRAGVSELERRANQPGRRLTEAEKRVLERIGPRVNPGGTNLPGRGR